MIELFILYNYFKLLTVKQTIVLLPLIHQDYTLMKATRESAGCRQGYNRNNVFLVHRHNT